MRKPSGENNDATRKTQDEEVRTAFARDARPRLRVLGPDAFTSI